MSLLDLFFFFLFFSTLKAELNDVKVVIASPLHQRSSFPLPGLERGADCRGFFLLLNARGINEENQNAKILSTGIKVIGGVKELTGEEFGVYVKRILPGGLASSDGEYRQPASVCVFVESFEF